MMGLEAEANSLRRNGEWHSARLGRLVRQVARMSMKEARAAFDTPGPVVPLLDQLGMRLSRRGGGR
jgi:hypothetical protein